MEQLEFFPGGFTWCAAAGGPHNAFFVDSDRNLVLVTELQVDDVPFIVLFIVPDPSVVFERSGIVDTLSPLPVAISNRKMVTAGVFITVVDEPFLAATERCQQQNPDK